MKLDWDIGDTEIRKRTKQEPHIEEFKPGWGIGAYRIGSKRLGRIEKFPRVVHISAREDRFSLEVEERLIVVTDETTAYRAQGDGMSYDSAEKPIDPKKLASDSRGRLRFCR